MTNHSNTQVDRSRSTHEHEVRSQSPQTAVVEAVSSVRGVDPVDLDVRLHDAIDADVLDMLAGHDGGDWRLSFALEDHEVTVDADGTVVVDGRVFDGSFDA
ncbi:hypothetical protein Hbl1158_09670 [Halobaculum sp. CBA1158]|uniref:HalOD1 output domain-containing protein n=1 Tax=Halobaculum sp. CBA1158 TaxID=2904243 RepID=UPI001F2E05E3|nr:HalOD1 output domain-containing protein [Halobaculum sp. CBA1158]UIO98807.1 hypothetical protein Hbl1158_09670 [Halobaculum sp. CBA1158]